MFFRFACVLCVLTGVALIGIALERRNLTLKQTISSQYSEIDTLKTERCQLILQTQSLGAPLKLIESVSNRGLRKSGSTHPASGNLNESGSEDRDLVAPSSGAPLLEWRMREQRR